MQEISTNLEPSKEDFVEWLAKKTKGTGIKIGLSLFQCGIVESYVNLRKTLFSGGVQSGRTYILRLLKQYFDEEFPYAHGADSEDF